MALTKVTQHSLGNSAVTTAKLNLTAPLGIANSTANVIFMAANGNIGIGTNGPTQKLQVESSANLTIQLTKTGVASFLVTNNGTDGTELSVESVPMIFKSASTERMRIDSSGRLLIGTTNADVGGSVSGIRMSQTGDLISCIDGSGLLHYQTPVAADRRNTAGDGVMYGMWRAGIYQCGIGATNGSAMTFFTGNNASQTERMRIDSQGRLLFGKTVSTATTPGIVLTGAGQYQSNVNNDWNMELFGNGGFRIRFNGSDNGTSTVGSITSGTSSTSYTTTSDYRLKENITPMTGALNKISQLKPCTYTWKSTGEAGQGFIAHELQVVVPDAVTGEKDAVNEDGSINPQGVDTSFLVATLTAAIQELKAEFDAYKASHP